MSENKDILIEEYWRKMKNSLKTQQVTDKLRGLIIPPASDIRTKPDRIRALLIEAGQQDVPSNDQIWELSKALEILVGQDQLSVRGLLEAQTKRSDICRNGVFDPIVADNVNYQYLQRQKDSFKMEMDQARKDQNTKIDELKKQSEEVKGNPIKQKYIQDLKNEVKRAVDAKNEAKKFVHFEPPQKIISHGKKDEEKGESNVYNQSRVTVPRSALKQVFKGTLDQFCFYVHEAHKKNSKTYFEKKCKTTPGSLNYSEFLQIYKEDYAFLDRNADPTKIPVPLSSFNVDESIVQENWFQLNPEQQLTIKLQHLLDFVKKNQGEAEAKAGVAKRATEGLKPHLLDQLKYRAKNNNPKFSNVLREDFEEAIINFGCLDRVPLPIFRKIMASYLLEVSTADIKDMKEKCILIDQKKLVFNQENEQEVILFKVLLKYISPEVKQAVRGSSILEIANAAMMVIKIQRSWRRASAIMKNRDILTKKRLEDEERRRAKFSSPKKGKKVAQVTNKSLSLDSKPAEGEKKKGLTKEEIARKKEKEQAAIRLEKRKNESLEKRLGQNMKSSSKDPFQKERVRLQEIETKEYMMMIIEQLITKTVCIGESFHKGLEIQKDFENRPVQKFVYPLSQQFQITSTGIATKSLQYFNSLGQVMFLNSQNQLSQYDITQTQTPLQVINLGTRPPLKHYDIIDMIIDQKSGRVYTLNLNWILEIWNIEQKSDFPQKRIVICSTEEGRNYIGNSYKQTFNDAKPRFLCLQESNQQVLVVNTSCVDGSLVFIDPISFSVLKKIQLKYQDYEISRKLKKSLAYLQNFFEAIEKSHGADFDLFSELVDAKTDTIDIEKMVNKLYNFDKEQSKEHLRAICEAVDEDGSGTIDKEEFLRMFGQVKKSKEQDEQQAIDELLVFEEMWPAWVSAECLFVEVETMLLLMHDCLNQNLGVKPASAFSIYDLGDTGFCTEDEFKRAFSSFFKELLATKKIDFKLMLRLTVSNSQGKINYSKFCLFLQTKFVKQFKHIQNQNAKQDAEQAGISQLQLELNFPIVKEPTLTYVLRKAADLNIDLRKEFSKNDPLDLSVIPRIKFWDILKGIPIGLGEDDLTKIFYADPKEGAGVTYTFLNYDNYGNVDYVSILNSDMFVELERRRLTKLMIQQGKDKNKSQNIDQKPNSKKEMALADNRRVVIEDLVFIDDLEIIIYTTVKPRTSTIFITSLQKQTSQKGEEEDLIASKYKLIAKLKGHKNQDAPSICYVPQSNCLISGEKHVFGNEMPTGLEDLPKATDPESIPTHKVKKVKQNAYSQFSRRHLSTNFKSQCQILVWNLQKDLIAKFKLNSPWNVTYQRKFTAHDASIIDLVYMTKSQILVSTSMDQTIRFWDPVSIAYDLTEPHSYPLSHVGGGKIEKIKPEKTKSNAPFKEVKRIYTGADSVCYALRTLCIQNIILEQPKPDKKKQGNSIKSQIEWLICLKNLKQKGLQDEFTKKNRPSIVSGYSIERIKLEVPAKHVDDIVPVSVVKECEDLVDQRRLKLIIQHQRQLPVTVVKILSQSQLQATQMENIRALFMQSILNRKDGKYVNPEPLREIYNIIIKLPNRTKFQAFLSSSGCSNKLSVSETFFYLQKFMQIQPLRTTQIEFEKQIETFYNLHQRQFLGGVKRWTNPVVQKLANYIRLSNLDVEFFQRDPRMIKLDDGDSEEGKYQHFKYVKKCTRDRFYEYIKHINIMKEMRGHEFKESDIKILLNEMDPYNTGFIQLDQVQKFFNEEVTHENEIASKRESEIIAKIRSMLFPIKTVALQKALFSADEEGDKYLTKTQFVDAIFSAKIDIEREQLEILFEILASPFEKSVKLFEKEESSQKIVYEKHLSLTKFMNRLYTQIEMEEISDVNHALTCIKSALIYKDIDFRSIFKKTNGTKKIQESGSQQDYVESIDHQSFIKAVKNIQAPRVTDLMIEKLANYLRLNQKDNQKDLIFQSSWLVNLRRVPTQLCIPDDQEMVAISYIILRNKELFRSYVQVFEVKAVKKIIQSDKEVQEKKLKVNIVDLVEIIQKFCNISTSRWEFLQQIIHNRWKTHKNVEKGDQSICIDEMIKYMRENLPKQMQDLLENSQKQPLPQNIVELMPTTFFQIFQKMRDDSGVEIDPVMIINKCKQFDTNDSGSIPVYALLNIIKNNNSGVFRSDVLILIRYELERLTYDGSVDYHTFINSFNWGANSFTKQIESIQLNEQLVKDFEEILKNICQVSQQNQVDVEKSFKVVADGRSLIKVADLNNVFKLLGYTVSEKQLGVIVIFSCNENQTIDWYDLAIKIKHATELLPMLSEKNWLNASHIIIDHIEVLEQVQENQKLITEYIMVTVEEKRYKIVKAERFQKSVQKSGLNLNEEQLTALTKFAVKGSQIPEFEGVYNEIYDLIQVKYFWQMLPLVITEMKYFQNNQRQLKMSTKVVQDPVLERNRKAFMEHERKELKISQRDYDIQEQMVKKITDIFAFREITFADCFHEVYDPLMEVNVIKIKLFKELVQSLNLPLSFQDQRILRKIADPQCTGKVDLNKFMPRFDTETLRSIRLNKVLDKLAVKFYVEDFQINKAFKQFDHQRSRQVSQVEFVQAISSLQIDLSTNEINDLMQLVIKSNRDTINYYDFITEVDLNIKHRREDLQDQIKQAVINQLAQIFPDDCEDVKRTISLFDFDNNEPSSVLISDLPRILKRLGLKNVDKHLDLVLKLAGYNTKVSGVIIAEDFVSTIQASIKQRMTTFKQQSNRVIGRLFKILKASGLSLFDLFMKLDRNGTFGIDKIELKTGIQALGMPISNEEFSTIWNAMHQPNKSIGGRKDKEENLYEMMLPKEPELSYLDMVSVFTDAGFLETKDVNDGAHILIAKFRQFFKMLRLNVDQAYKEFDPRNLGIVLKNDFMDILRLKSSSFNEEQMFTIFEEICKQGLKEGAPLLARFTKQQFFTTIQVVKEPDWFNQVCIKIHSKVLQIGTTYKKLFLKWAPSNQGGVKKGAAFSAKKKVDDANIIKIKKPELSTGLRNLKAGLTFDEIQSFVEALQFEKTKATEQQYIGGPKQAIFLIAEPSFEQMIVQNLKETNDSQDTKTKLKNLILTDWIQQINNKIRPGKRIDENFEQHDLDQEGALSLVQFQEMCLALDITMSKRDLKTVFERMVQTEERILLSRLKHFISLDYKRDEDKLKEAQKAHKNHKQLGDEALERPNDKLNRLKTNEIYEDLSTYCEHHGCTFESVFFTETEEEMRAAAKLAPSINTHKDHEDHENNTVMPSLKATINGIKRGLERFKIVLNIPQAQTIISDIQKMTYRLEVTYKDFVDFMLKRKKSLKFLEQGYISPMIASCMTQINQVRSLYNLTVENFFIYINGNQNLTGISDFLVPNKDNTIEKQKFIKALAGMNLGMAVEDIADLFNYIDTGMNGYISMKDFQDAIEHINKRMGGQAQEENLIDRGLLRSRKAINMRMLNLILNQICSSINQRDLTLMQLYKAMDINKNGFINRVEFVIIMQQINSMLKLDQIRVVAEFFDDKHTGKIVVIEFLLVIKELLNYSIGGGVFSDAQVQPIIRRIVQELSLDSDKFFDELSDKNFKWRKTQELKQNTETKISKNPFVKVIGLSKSVLFNLLNDYGIVLRHEEKAILTSCFGAKHSDTIDFTKIDNAFENAQQELYNAGKFVCNSIALAQKETPEWERRCFRRIGQYLMSNNISIYKFFQIEESLREGEFKAIQRSSLNDSLASTNLFSSEIINKFLDRVDSNGAVQLESRELLQRYWAAYTFEETFNDFDDDEMKAYEESCGVKKQQHEHDRFKMRYETKTLLVPTIYSSFQKNVTNLRFFNQVQDKFQEMIKERNNSSIVWSVLDPQGNSILRLKEFCVNFQKHFQFQQQTAQQLRDLFQQIDQNGYGSINSYNITVFCKSDFTGMIDEINTGYEFSDLAIIIHSELTKKDASVEELYNQLLPFSNSLKQKVNQSMNQNLQLEEIHETLCHLGFDFNQKQAFEILKVINPSLTKPISYEEFLDKVGMRDMPVKKVKSNQDVELVKEFYWRDKALELIITTFKNQLGNKAFKEYFRQYDQDCDKLLTPSEFRQSILDLKEPQIKQIHIERLIHLLVEDVGGKPYISLPKARQILSTYKCQELNDGSGSGQVLIDEDLFVYIVKKYDGLSRMMEFVFNMEDKSTYLSRHTYEINMRGFTMASNQFTLKNIKRKSELLNTLFQGTLVLIATEIMRLIKNEAQLCALDPTTNIDNIISDQNIGALTSISLPSIDSTQLIIEYATKTVLPCGANRFLGTYLPTKERIEILQYPSDILAYVSLDGKTLKRHLASEIQTTRYLMGCKYEEDDELVNPEFALKEPQMDIFPNLGKFEKQTTIEASSDFLKQKQKEDIFKEKVQEKPKDQPKDIYIVNKAVNEDLWVNLDDFVKQNGGILNVPLFYHTDAPLFIIRHWAKLILQIIEKCHDVSVVLRCLNTKQLWMSRDGQRVKLGHVRGIGKVNNLGYISSSPDVFLNLENNEEKKTDQQKKKKSDDQRKFCNIALDNPFIAPEVLFSKFQDHTDALDVWSFGMIMFCILFGRQPTSFYKMLREWEISQHSHDLANDSIPFTRSSANNFLYDPFSIDFENPINKISIDDLIEEGANKRIHSIDDDSSEQIREGAFNFNNFMNCIENLSYSAMFSSKFSKKFDFQPIVGENETEETPEALLRFSGQRKNQSEIRKQVFKLLAKDSVLRRKNELGLILDLLASCLDVDAKFRPTIKGLLNSHIFKLDQFDMLKAVRFSQNVILYRSPISNVSVALIQPLRQICSETMKAPFSIYEHRYVIGKLFDRVEDCLNYEMKINHDDERRVAVKGLKSVRFVQDQFGLKVSQNAPLAAQIIEEKVVDMLLFITFRYMKNFNAWKERQIQEEKGKNTYVVQWDEIKDNKEITKPININDKKPQSSPHKKSSPERKKQPPAWDALQKKMEIAFAQKVKEKQRQMHRLENHVLNGMIRLLKTMTNQMKSDRTPLAPFVADVINYIVKFFLGEEHTFGSETVLLKTASKESKNLKDFLCERSFFRRESDFNSEFKSDNADKLWHMEQKNLVFLDKSNYWTPELYEHALKIYKEVIGENGQGSPSYPIVQDYIKTMSENPEKKEIFEQQMNNLSVSYLIPMLRTQAYYTELIPIGNSVARLYDKNIEIKAKQGSLAMIRSVFQTANSDKIKACLDMRVPKHLIQYLQDSSECVRQESLYTFLEISKGLQDDDFEIKGRHAGNLKQELSKLGYTKTTFDLHKAVSMSSQQEVLDADDRQRQIDGQKKRGRQAKQEKQETQMSQEEKQTMQMKKTIALIEKNDNERYINFALDLPNLYFLASKRFLREMAVCFESPVFIAPLVRLLKTPTESNHNKEIILSIFNNLVCGSERVLIALNSPACDSYFTLLKILMVNSKMASAKANPNSSGLTTQMKQQLKLQDKTKKLFEYIFQQRRPTILRDISTISSHKSMLRDQELQLPDILKFNDVLEFYEQFAFKTKIRPEDLNFAEIETCINNTRCWVKHFYEESKIPKLTRIKALQRCMNTLVRILKFAWKDYFVKKQEVFDSQNIHKTDHDFNQNKVEEEPNKNVFYNRVHKEEHKDKQDHKGLKKEPSKALDLQAKDDPKVVKKEVKKLSEEELQKHIKIQKEYEQIIQMSFQLIDWLCINNKEFFIFQQEEGLQNLSFMINLFNLISLQFRMPIINKKEREQLDKDKIEMKVLPDAKNKKYETSMLPLDGFNFKDWEYDKVQHKRKYDIFPFTNTGAILQNILYQLVRKNDENYNRLICLCNFGQNFGEELLLEYEFIRHCIDNKVESLVLMDSYVKKNEIRLNTFEYILRSSSNTLKDQLTKSNVIERVFTQYISDYREFNIQFSKINLEFLAFRRSYPLRLEAISMFNCALMLKQFAPQVYSEFLMYSRRHLLIRTELDILKASEVVNGKETTVLLLFAMILESNESDLIYSMVQEGAPNKIRELMKGQPSLSRRFPVLQTFIGRF